MVAMTARTRRPLVTPFHSDAVAGDPPTAGLDQRQALDEHAAGLLAGAGALRAAARDSATSSVPLRLTRRVRIHVRGGRARPIVRTTHSAILDSLSQSGLVAQQ
jgi:hypothetical protein